MAGVPVVEVAALEQVPPGTVAARLSRARRVVGDALADVVPATPVSIGPYGHVVAGRPDEEVRHECRCALGEP